MLIILLALMVSSCAVENKFNSKRVETEIYMEGELPQTINWNYLSYNRFSKKLKGELIIETEKSGEKINVFTFIMIKPNGEIDTICDHNNEASKCIVDVRISKGDTLKILSDSMIPLIYAF